MYDDTFGHWLSGLVDGEGCFHARYHIRKSDGAHALLVYFSIKMRADDLDMLTAIRDTLGVGVIYTHSEKSSKHLQADYHIVRTKDQVNVLIPHFDRYPLRSKKRRDYEIWRKIVLEYKAAPRRHNSKGISSLAEERWKEVCTLVDVLRNTRQFR